MRLTKLGFRDGRASNGAPFKPVEERAPKRRTYLVVWLDEGTWFEARYEAGRRGMSIAAIMRWTWELAREQIRSIPSAPRDA